MTRVGASDHHVSAQNAPQVTVATSLKVYYHWIARNIARVEQGLADLMA
ncbi:hypothetical protein [uncultured Paludibaculum sp.]|nr:hypothetical protein [uncultured Paludibaculum sp.]